MATIRTDILGHRRRSWALVAVLIVGLTGVMLVCPETVMAQGGRLGNYQITAVPNPRSVPADGKTAARIRIEVRDNSGRPAPDGTKVVVSTDLGHVGESEFDRTSAVTVETTAGFAMVFATSDTPGLATIRASVGTSRSNNVYLEFRPEGQAAGPELRVVNSGADIVQLDVANMVLRAQPATITRDEQQLTGENLFFQFNAKRGAVQQLTDAGLQQVGFDIYNVKARPLDWDLPNNPFRLLPVVGDTWLIADSITLFVGEKIVLRHAAVYVGSDKVASLPPYLCPVIPALPTRKSWE